MSHIPNAAMKHAGPVHHETKAAARPEETAAPQPHRRPGAGIWWVIGGTILGSTAAAIALPLLRRAEAPAPARRDKKVNSAKRRARSPRSSAPKTNRSGS
ncbi:hypothetical protein FHY05_002089 [Sphingomonas sp. BK580]|nr:hypothetical protein [Sphingomonas sp. BK580]